MECIDVFRTRLYAGGRKPTNSQIGDFLDWAESAQTLAGKLKRGDDMIALARSAYNLGKDCTIRDGIRALAGTINRSAKIHYDSGRFKEAIDAYLRAIEVCKPTFDQAPWNWYMRQNVGGDYMHLAETYQKIGDFRNEVLSWREYLKIWLGPMQGMKIDEFIAPGRPADEPEAVRLARVHQFLPGLEARQHPRRIQRHDVSILCLPHKRAVA